jgi:hypothetical protein
VLQPDAQWGRERRRIHRRHRGEFIQKRRQAELEIGQGDGASEQHGQGDCPTCTTSLRASMRATPRSSRGQAARIPRHTTAGEQPEALKRRAERVLDEAQTSFRCKDDSIRAQRTVAAAGPDEWSAASGGVISRMIQVTIAGCSPLRSFSVGSSDSRCPACARRRASNRARSGTRPRGSPQTPNAGIVTAARRPHAGVVEDRTDGELALESQQLQRDRVGVVEHQEPIAEAVASSWCVPAARPAFDSMAESFAVFIGIRVRVR